MILHLGVHDIPEPMSTLSTYDVGMILEEEYGLFSTFYDLNKDFINEEVSKYISDALTAANSTEAAIESRFLDAISLKFKLMLEQREFDGKLPNVPVKAALEGYHRGKKTGNPKGRPKKGATRKTSPSRPSFVDTHTLKNSLATWITP